MTDATLEDFGVSSPAPERPATPERDGEDGQDDEDEIETPHRHETYHNGRCRAISADGMRCLADSQMSSDLCGAHDRAADVTTIDDGPRELIEATLGVEWRNFGNWWIRGAVKDREWELEHGEGGASG